MRLQQAEEGGSMTPIAEDSLQMRRTKSLAKEAGRQAMGGKVADI